MKQSSLLFPMMARALEGAVIEPGDADWKWPQTVLPVIQSQHCIQPYTAVAAGTLTCPTSVSSFITSMAISRGAAAASQTTQPFVLGQGIWSYSADWFISQAQAANQNLFFAQLMTPDFGTAFGSQYSLLDIGAVTADVRFLVHMEHTFAIPNGMVMRFRHTIDNTAGATSTTVTAFFNLRRLA